MFSGEYVGNKITSLPD